MKASLALLVAVVSLSACGDSSVSGSWEGDAAPEGVTLTFTLTLTDDDGAIAGSGSISGTSTVAMTVSGSRKDEDVDLTLTSTGYADSSFSAKLTDDDAMAGTWTEPGLSFALALSRR